MASHVKSIVTILSLYFVIISSEQFIDKRPINYPDYDQQEYRDILKGFGLSEKDSPVQLTVETGDDDGRFCMTVTTMKQPYQFKPKVGAPKFIVQSKYFQQVIPQTRCKQECSKCCKDFEDFMDYRTQLKCKTNKGYMTVLVHDTEKNKFVWLPVPIDVSCSFNSYRQ